MGSCFLVMQLTLYNNLVTRAQTIHQPIAHKMAAQCELYIHEMNEVIQPYLLNSLYTACGPPDIYHPRPPSTDPSPRDS